MNGDETMDLSSLGDVTSPDVVRSAFRRFRRRVFTTGALVAVSALSLTGGLAWALYFNRTLAEQVAGAPGATLGVTVTTGDVVTIVERVARLDHGLAIHLYRASPDAERGFDYTYRFAGVRNAEQVGTGAVGEHYYVIAPPDDGLVRGTLRVQDGCRPPPGGGFCRARPEPLETFTIDLAELGVPEDVWEE